MTMRWRMTEPPRGLARIAAPPRGHELRLADGGQAIAWALPLVDHRTRRVSGWYWVVSCDGVPYRNTCNDPLTPNADEAKAAARAYVEQFMGVAK